MLFLRVFFDFFFIKNGYCIMSVNSEYLMKKNRIFNDVDNGCMVI